MDSFPLSAKTNHIEGIGHPSPENMNAGQKNIIILVLNNGDSD